MSSSHTNPKTLADMPETDAIRQLLSVVNRRSANRPRETPCEQEMESSSAPADAAAPAMVFVADDTIQETPPPLPPMPEFLPMNFEPPPLPPEPTSEALPPVLQPIAALSFGELLRRINWRNRPDAVPPLPLIGVPQPTGFADTVEAVLSAFCWDDE